MSLYLSSQIYACWVPTGWFHLRQRAAGLAQNRSRLMHADQLVLGASPAGHHKLESPDLLVTGRSNLTWETSQIQGIDRSIAR